MKPDGFVHILLRGNDPCQLWYSFKTGRVLAVYIEISPRTHTVTHMGPRRSTLPTNDNTLDRSARKIVNIYEYIKTNTYIINNSQKFTNHSSKYLAFINMK